MHHRLASAFLPVVLACAGVAAASCSASSQNNGFTTSTGQGNGGASSTGTDDIGFDAGGVTGGAAGDAGSTACAADPHKAETIPLDMFIMLDQSGSMSETVSGGGTKWTAVTNALESFLNQPGLGGISVGLNYFGLPPGGSAVTCNPVPFCATDADCGAPACGPCQLVGFVGICAGAAQSDSCNPADYAGAAVEIAPLPGVAQSIIASIAQHGPSTGTPTSAALQGGIDHCKAWAGTHPGHAVVHVFATDGEPSGCNEDLGYIDGLAAAGAAGSPKILTFVIGVGQLQSALDGIAAAGGTHQAYIVDTAGNATQQFLQALNAIRGAALGCQYDIPVPATGTPDFGRVNVQYTPGGGGPQQVFGHVSDKAACPPGGDAWYYDDNSNPKVINLCDATCNKVGADTKGQIDILLGCKTQEAQ